MKEKYYIVVNKDGSIHTIAEKDDDVLRNGQTRFEIKEKPQDNPNNYKWNFKKNELIKKTTTEIKKNIAQEKEESKFYLLDNLVNLLLKMEKTNKIKENYKNVNFNLYIDYLSKEIKKIEDIINNKE